MRGFEPAGGLLREPIRKAGETRGFAASRVLTHWDEIVGPDMAALCRPVKVSYGKGGMGATLTVLASGAAAQIVQMRLPQILAKVNAAYGYGAIARIHITQTAAAMPAREPANIVAPGPEAMQRAAAVVAQAGGGVANDDLRAALERLAQNVMTRQKGSGNETR
jgi:hypothetical protein